MDYMIREMQKQEYPLLDNFLYEMQLSMEEKIASVL